MYCLTNFLTSNSLFVKKLLPAIRSFKGIIIFSIEYNTAAILFVNCAVYFTELKIFSHPVLLTHFQRISEHQSPRNKQLIQAAISSEQHGLYWNDSSHFKQLLFRRKIYFRLSSCLEQILLFNNYFLVTKTFSDQLLFAEDFFLQKK